MKNSILNRIGAVFVVALAANTAQAEFLFSGQDAGGVGSATMDFVTSGNQLTVTVNNTSPVDLIGGSSGGNSPGISGFGFNLDPNDLSLVSWSLTAYDSDNALTTIGSSTNNSLDWQMGDFLAGVTLDYLPNNGGVADGMLFNPAAISDSSNTLPGGQNDRYFTTAILTMDFDKSPSLAQTAGLSPFVRMQNVGRNGAGSLKIYGDGSFEPGPGVPVPAPLVLLGVGGMMLGWRVWKQRA
jgi:hypothetical protein